LGARPAHNFVEPAIAPRVASTFFRNVDGRWRVTFALDWARGSGFFGALRAIGMWQKSERAHRWPR
jgi:hypothetical protein